MEEGVNDEGVTLPGKALFDYFQIIRENCSYWFKIQEISTSFGNVCEAEIALGVGLVQLLCINF